MKTLFVMIALCIAGIAHADCSVFEDGVKRSRLRADAIDPVKGRILFGEGILRSEYMLKDCLESEQRFKTQEAHRAKFPAPRIGQRKQETNWGYPEYVSTTTTARGVMEVQIYPGSNSLVYVNNVLQVIQRSN